MNILTILGARPQFIKAAAVSLAFQKEKELEETIIHTGQHFDEKMSEIFFQELKIPTPKYNLQIGGGSHAYNTGRSMEGIENIITDLRPEGVLVYGDTDSTLAGALASAKLNCPVFHVESGLRSFNKTMPEEINRILTDHVSTLLFTPTETAVKNLLNEGISEKKIKPVGDVMLDSILIFAEIAKRKSNILKHLKINENYLLVTIHRKENVDNINNIKNIFIAIEKLEKITILPLHPRLRNLLKKHSLKIPKNLKIIEPLGYLDMISLLDNCNFVMTDSGGLQKEAYFRKKYCITLRQETEWIELVNEKVNILADTNIEKILQSAQYFQNKNFIEQKNRNIFGNGSASEKIIEEIKKHLKNEKK